MAEKIKLTLLITALVASLTFNVLIARGQYPGKAVRIAQKENVAGITGRVSALGTFKVSENKR